MGYLTNTDAAGRQTSEQLRDLERIVSELKAKVGQIYQQVMSGNGNGFNGGGVGAAFLVTTAVPEMVGTTPGVGHGTLLTLSSGVFVTTSLDADLYSILLDKIIAVGAVVLAETVNGEWFVNTVDSCENLLAAAGPSPPPVPGPGTSGGALSPVVTQSSPDALVMTGPQPRFTFTPGSPVQGG